MVKNMFSQETLNKFTDLMRIIWNGNRYFDRACNVLKTKFKMYNLENVLHENYAHFFPAFSDYVVSFLEGYNQEVIYPSTEDGAETYDNVVGLIITLREYYINVFKAGLFDFVEHLKNGNIIEKEFAFYILNENNKILDKTQRLIKIENIIVEALRPDSTMFDVIDLDNFAKW